MEVEFLERVSDVFKRKSSEAEKELEQERQHVANLERKVGQLTYEVDWLKKDQEIQTLRRKRGL